MYKIVLSLIGLLLGSVSYASHNGPELLLLHGALFTAEGWHKVQTSLTQNGHQSTAIDLPGRNGDLTSPKAINLLTASKRVCEFISTRSDPVILVGHSQGGAVITQAVAMCPSQIKALVYIAAVVPKSGELPFDRLTKKDNEMFDRCATYDDLEKVYRVNRFGPLWQAFMADLSKQEAEIWAQKMVAEPSEIGNTRLDYSMSEFERIPKFYVETTRDLIISPETQKEIQKGVRFVETYSINSSHSPFLSQPETVSRLLVEVKKYLH